MSAAAPMTVTVLPTAVARLLVRPWPDPVIDALGHDPRSAYVERFWLGVLGPTATWLLRAVAHRFEEEPAGFHLDVGEAARTLGLGGGTGRHSPFVRAIGRCCQFGLAQPVGAGTIAVRRKLPPLTRHQVSKLPPGAQQAHRAWQQEALRRPDVDQLRHRGRRLALSLFELGEDAEATERQLLRWRFPPVLAREATAWALDRHRRAAAEAETGGDGPAA
ncbi:MAG TPA: hypothetical protein VF640_00075 [Acidimicrobiales bacterium]|jgi:hypothetical protein